MLTLLACLAIAGRPQAVTKEIPVKNTQPSEVLRMLKEPMLQGGSGIPASVEFVHAYNRGGVLEARGTAGGLRQLEERISIVDIKPRAVRLDLSLVRVGPAANGRPDEETLYSVTVETGSSREILTAIPLPSSPSRLVSILPRLNGDDSVSLFLGFGELAAAKDVLTTNRRLRQNSPLVVGMQEVAEAAARDDHRIMPPPDDYLTRPGLYLRITPRPAAR